VNDYKNLGGGGLNIPKKTISVFIDFQMKRTMMLRLASCSEIVLL